MGKFSEDAAKLLAYVGGKENINAITHCVTRMRFVLADPKKANIKKIESLPSVKGTFTQAGQFQVIIGNEVADFYKEFTAISGIEGVSKEATKQAAKGNQTPLQKAMSNIAEIFAPLIPAIICGGLILGFRNMLEVMVVLEEGSFLAGLDKFLWIIGEAVFHTGIPVGICWSVQRKMGGTYPDLRSAGERLRRGRHGSGRLGAELRLELRFPFLPYDRLSGAGHPGDPGSVHPCLSGEIL